MNKLRALEPRELEEITAFAAEEGRRWKHILMYEYWMKGLPVRGRSFREYPTLYGLRNTHGPSWLDDFRLPKVSS